MTVNIKEIIVFIPCKNKHRSKRLMKKLHLGEFKEMGFSLIINFKPEVTEDEREDFFYKFIINCIEANNLLLGGMYNDAFICREKGSCDLNDRLIVSEYLIKHNHLLEAYVSILKDAWYPTF